MCIRIFCIILVAVMSSIQPVLSQESEQQTQVVMLGTGSPNPDPERSGPSVAIIVKGTPYLFDFGAGVIRRASAAFNNGIQALAVRKLRIAFSTHLHSDHTLGYADLILTPWIIGRDVPLEVYGPPGIEEMTKSILKAYEKDIDIRVNGLQPSNTTGYAVNAHVVSAGVVYKDENVTVKAFPVGHGAWDYAFGYRIETPDRTIVISGDRRPNPDITEYSKDCDVLIHEVYSEEGFKKRNTEWQKYHADSHTSSTELGALATRVRPQLLILNHQMLWGTTPDDLLQEIGQVYDGKVVYGNDLDVY
jgi:ribonuclease BN (tRNA processing enzyme)